MFILAGFLMASLPFFFPRLLGTTSIKPLKAFVIFAVVSFLFFAIVIAAALMVEQYLGQRTQQSWEFYTVLTCLWIVAAFPGFLWRYLRRPSLTGGN
ncbi:MAG: DUF2818 family protein [Burkholderiaceae bacterium]|nr:DUF2818 family protein [Burkholderiaceae bacterium]